MTLCSGCGETHGGYTDYNGNPLCQECYEDWINEVCNPPKVEIPIASTYDPTSETRRVSNLTDVERMIEHWCNQVYDPKNHQPSEEDYKRDVLLIEYTPRISWFTPPLRGIWKKFFYKRKIKREFKGCYPVSVSSLDPESSANLEYINQLSTDIREATDREIDQYLASQSQEIQD